MKIRIVTPAPPGSRHGNRNTALRWAAHLRALGHRVGVDTEWRGAGADALIALHARRSHASIAAWKNAHPGRALVLALTGTDLYRDIVETSADGIWAAATVSVGRAAAAADDPSVREKSR